MTATLVSACCWLCSPTRPCAQRGQLGERRRIAGAGHLGGQVVPRRGEPQQPVQAGPDHIGADQHQQPGAQVRQRLGRGRCRPAAASPAGPRRRWPATAAASCRRAGARSQPSTASTPSRRSAGWPGCPTRTAPPAPGPAPRTGAPRSPATTRRPAAAETPPPVARRSDFTEPAHRRRDHRPAPAATLSSGGHDPVLAEQDLQALGAVSRRRRRAGSRSRRRAWNASTSAITSSVTGFR